MKILVLIFLLVPIQLLAQLSKKISFTNELNSATYELTPNTLAPSSIHFPFGNIKILDVRFDTSKLGFESAIRYHNVKLSDFKMITLKGGVQQGIESFYNNYYSLCFKDPAYNLFIVLKTLWIDNFPGKININGLEKNVAYKESFQDVHLKFEYYFQKDNSFYPVKRIDTVFKLTEGLLNLNQLSLKKNDLSFFTYAIKSALEICDFDFLKSKIPNTKQLSLANIDSFNLARFRLPVLTTNTLKKGIYLDYKELLNNSPSVTNFELKSIKKVQFYFNNQKEERVKKWFAVMDDSGLHSGATANDKIIRVGNTFEGFTLHYMQLPKTAAGTLLNVAAVGLNLANYESKVYYPVDFGKGITLYPVLVPRQFNLDTGEIY